jgi:DNA-binding CsgD family transcriptional regulator
LSLPSTVGHDVVVAFDQAVTQARAAVADGSWAAARAAYAEADRAGTLGAADLEAWGLAALLTGRDAESDAVREQAHAVYARSGDRDGAARCAFWLGLALVMRGETARGAGWSARMREGFADGEFVDTVWHGYECVNRGMRALFGGDLPQSLALHEQARAVAEHVDDPDLRILAGNGHGQALLATGDTAAGMSELDEVMVIATTRATNPQAIGLVYCAVIAVCRRCLDLTRSAEWTEVLGRWCEAQPDLVPYQGQCQVHRSELLQLQGRWDAAFDEAEQTLARLADAPTDAAVGMAHYQLGELHRLRGGFDDAEQSYRHALQVGHDPQPGLALMRLAQGRADTARLAIGRALEEASLPFARTQLLPAAVEIALAVGDVAFARESADELVEASGRLDSGFLDAAAGLARGALALASGDASSALVALRTSLRRWRELDAPYEAARCRVLLAAACRALGDEDTAALELEAARTTFAGLGARHDLAVLAGESGSPQRTDGLTPRELEVLRLVASGATNRDIATNLVLSEKTVARHVANIFLKIGVSARSAATAYAYEHHLV